ncbi:glycosyltransferase [Azonexus fungiphilus]|uniref:glycosyltransferase n=1 Tax=Azonexus fungiphilus TaxID=146940 RepID=UPI00156AFBC7|nr:glycosyltransferase [Azonexus fungiphilus]NHC07547.1 glycosyltransferase [Azonexus fungiphilus]
MQCNKVLYIVPPSRQFAGIERVVHELSNGMSCLEKEFEIEVYYSSNYQELKNEDVKYKFNMAGCLRIRDAFFSIAKFLRINKYKLIVVAQWEMTTLVFLLTRILGLNSSVICHLHGNPWIEKSKSRINSFLYFFFKKIVAKRLVEIFCVSSSLANKMTEELGTETVPISYLPNPVRKLRKDSAHFGQKKEFVTVGRLSYQKGHDTLLRAFSKFVNLHPEARLTVVGDGPLRKYLEDLTGKLNIRDNVLFTGFVSDPSQFLSHAKYFCFPSRWEGFGLALIEALQFDLYLISTDCDFGPADIIKSDDVGVLSPVDDVDAFFNNMVKAYSDEFTGSEQRAKVVEKFSIGEVSRIHAENINRILFGLKNEISSD